MVKHLAETELRIPNLEYSTVAAYMDTNFEVKLPILFAKIWSKEATPQGLSSGWHWGSVWIGSARLRVFLRPKALLALTAPHHPNSAETGITYNN